MPIRNPDRRKEYHREYARLRRARQTGSQTRVTPGTALLPAEFRLRTAADVLALLAEQVAAVRADPKVSTLERARVIGGLAAVSLRAIEAGDVAARVEALEAALRGRPKPEGLSA